MYAVLSGRAVVNLNFTTGRAALDSSVAQAGLRTVVTSRTFLEKAAGHIVAFGCQEREEHAAAHQDGVRLAEEVVDDCQLVGDLRAAEHGDERAIGVVAHAAENFDLASEQPARRRRQKGGRKSRSPLASSRGASSRWSSRAARWGPSPSVGAPVAALIRAAAGE